MAHAFVRRADGLVMCRLEAEEKAVIAQVAQEVSELIRTDLSMGPLPSAVQQAARSEDPLERLEADFAAPEVRAPRDPAVRRLLPAASEDEEIAAEMRRLGQGDLVDAKLRAIARIPAVLDASGPGHTEVVLDASDAHAWMVSLTDLRLVLAERLGLRSDGDAETLRMLQQIAQDADLPREPGGEAHAGTGQRGASRGRGHDPAPDAREREPQVAGGDLVLAVYDLLTWLQESLVEALDRGL